MNKIASKLVNYYNECVEIEVKVLYGVDCVNSIEDFDEAYPTNILEHNSVCSYNLILEIMLSEGLKDSFNYALIGEKNSDEKYCVKYFLNEDGKIESIEDVDLKEKEEEKKDNFEVLNNIINKILNGEQLTKDDYLKLSEEASNIAKEMNQHNEDSRSNTKADKKELNSDEAFMDSVNQFMGKLFPGMKVEVINKKL